MKIEKLSDNQIRCTLSGADLSLRNIALPELAYGSPKAKNLFQEMLQKASREVGFEISGSPLMVEAIPLGTDGIIVVITKVDDPEEIDSRFSKFIPMEEDESAISNMEAGSFDVLEGIGKLFSNNLNNEKSVESDPGNSIYVFNSIDEVMLAAKTVLKAPIKASALYKSKDNSNYYLMISYNEDEANSRLYDSLAEFAKKQHSNYSSQAYLNEHYEIIIAENAVQKLANI